MQRPRKAGALNEYDDDDEDDEARMGYVRKH